MRAAPIRAGLDWRWRLVADAWLKNLLGVSAMFRLFRSRKVEPPVAKALSPLSGLRESEPRPPVTVESPPEALRLEAPRTLTSAVPPVTPAPPAVNPKEPADALASTSFAKPFDENAYLEANPDVAQAVTNGEFRSGQHHYQLHGHRERRRLRR